MTKPLLTPKRISELLSRSLDEVEAAIRKRPAIRPSSRADSIPVFTSEDVPAIGERISGKEAKD